MYTYEKKNRAPAASRSSRLAHEVWGIILIFLSLFALVALVSYDHSDPSFFTQSKRLPLNYAGRVGANVAEAMIQLFGLAAFVFCGLFANFAVNFFRGAKLPELVARFIWHLLALLACATFISLVFGQIHLGGSAVSSGGWLGSWLAALLSRDLNLWGAILFTGCVLLIALIFSTPLSATALFEFIVALSLMVAKQAWRFGQYAAQLIHKGLIQTIRTAQQRRKTEHLLSGKLKNKAIPELEREPLPAPKASKARPLPVAVELGHDERENGFEVVAPVKAPPPASNRPARVTGSGKFTLPPLEFLNASPPPRADLDRGKLVENSKILEAKLTDFGIEGQVVAVRPGPVITMYEFKPGPGVKISQIAALADDLSLALSAQSVRIVAPIPGKSVVGIEIPNEERETVFLREILSTDEFQGNNGGIPLAIGKDISGAPIVSDISRMPHLLIAGASGKGKSVFINSLICSLLYKFTPNDLRLIMVDPKQVELNLYDDIPHLLLPVVDDMKKASTALKWVVNEMERRYKILAKTGVRNLAGFNQKLEKDGVEKLCGVLCPKNAEGMPDPGSLSHLFEHNEKGEPRIEQIPTILVIIDEFADLMMVAPKDIETSVARLGQKARAAGIHLVIATQRPSVDVITGLIKANLPSRISFQVASKIDSRTILDSMGAEKLLGQGDMLFIPPGQSRLVRIHGAFINEEEIGRICEHWRSQGEPVYKEEILTEPEETDGVEADGAGDELYQQAITVVREMGQASASMLQRRLKVGYNRAARMVEAMEVQGIVGPADGAKPREVLY